MSKFQDGFFQDLWCDMVLREADSIYCRFLLEEKKEQAYLAEHEEKKEKMIFNNFISSISKLYITACLL